MNDSAVREKLNGLSDTMMSIQTISSWFAFYKKRADNLVRVWAEECRSASPNRKLTLLYLANDVIQNERKKGTEFASAFANVLPMVFRELNGVPGKLLGKIDRVLNIWHERGVYDSEFVVRLKKLLGVSTDLKPIAPVNSSGRSSSGRQGNSSSRPRSPAGPPPASASGSIGGGSSGGGSVEDALYQKMTWLWQEVEHLLDIDAFTRAVKSIPKTVIEHGELFEVDSVVSGRERMKEVKRHESSLDVAIQRLGRLEDAYMSFLEVANDFVLGKTRDFERIKSMLVEYREKKELMEGFKEALSAKMQGFEDESSVFEHSRGSTEDVPNLPSSDDLFSGNDSKRRRLAPTEELEDDEDDEDEDGYDPENP